MSADGIPRAVGSGRRAAPPEADLGPRLLPSAPRALAAAGRGGAVLLILLGLGVLAGWALDVTTLKGVSPSWATMKPNTALSFLLLGVALLLRTPRVEGWRRTGADVAAVLLLAVAAATLAEYASGRDLGIDELLFADPATTGAPAGRMALATCLHFLLLGFAVVLLDVRGRRLGRPSEWLAILVALSSMVALLGYAYGVQALYAIPVYGSVAFHTTLAFLVASACVLMARGEFGVLRIALQEGPAGTAIRRLAPLAFVLPPLLGWLRIQGERHHLYPSEIGVALAVGTTYLCLFAVIAWTGHAILRSDAVRRRMEGELAESEVDLAITLDSIGDAVLATDAGGRVVRMNPMAEKLTGLRVEEARGRLLSDVLELRNPVTRGRLPSGADRVLRDGIGIDADGHALLRSKDGSEHTVADSAAPIRDARGETRGVVVVLRDVTDREMTRASLQETEAQLRQAQKLEAVGRLAASIAHELSNLLSVIHGHCALLADGLGPDHPLRGGLEEIVVASRRAASLMRQLQSFSREQVAAPGLVQVNEVLGAMARLLERLVGDKTTLSFRLSAAGRIHMDLGQLEQVLLNLVVRARDAMPSGGLLRIDTEDVECPVDPVARTLALAPGPYVRITLSASVDGVEPSMPERARAPLVPARAAGGGTELGLPTVSAIVRQGGGAIGVQDGPGPGSRFDVYLPAAREEVAPAEGAAHPTGSLRGTETILLVEDDDQLRRLTRTLLARNGYRVLDAASGAAALRICEQHPGAIDVMLTDVVMPLMSGRQLAERLAPVRPGMKVIFMSAYSDDAVLRHGIAVSTVEFLQKPIVPEQLLTKLRAVLRPGGPPA